MTIVTWTLIIIIASANNVTKPLIVGEYPTIDSCKKSASSAEYYQDQEWKPLHDLAVCVPKQVVTTTP